jgi:hypothetical protein
MNAERESAIGYILTRREYEEKMRTQFGYHAYCLWRDYVAGQKSVTLFKRISSAGYPDYSFTDEQANRRYGI